MKGNLRQDLVGLISSIVLAGVAAFYFSPIGMLYLFIVLGQAHFLMAYLYRWRAGKVTRAYASWYLLVAATLFTGALVFGFSGWLGVFTGALFAAHFAADEFRIAQLPFRVSRILIGFSFTAVFGAFLAQAIMHVEMLDVAIIISTLYLPVALGALWARREATRTDILMSVATIGTITLLSFSMPAPQTLLGFIIVFHYVRWYVHYFYRLAGDPIRRNAYVWHSAMMNLMMLALALHTGDFNLGFFFKTDYFYLWTILHIVFSYFPRSTPSIIPFIFSRQTVRI